MRSQLSAFAVATLSAATLVAPLLSHGQVSGAEDTKKSMQAQAERAEVIGDRGATRHYTKVFDLSALPHYRPSKQLSGWLRIHGNNYLVDGKLGQYWQDAFAKAQPGIRISWYLPTAAVAFASLYYNQADLVMGHKPSFYDLLAYQRILGFNPLEITAVTGSYDVPGWESATVILVNKDNPIRCISMKQLDGVFGAARDGGWAGTNFRPDWARGPEGDIRTWKQLGATGAWADKPIQTYGFNLRYNTATDFADRVMQGGDKWNENLHGFAHIVKPDGTRYIQGDQISDALARDKWGIAYSRFRGDKPGVKRIAVSEGDGKPCVDNTLETVQDRSYPLYNEQYFYTSVKPGNRMDPMTREFLKFVLSQEGQAEVMRDGKYLPLTAEVVREQLKKLDRADKAVSVDN
ncbi:MAG TPA: substrate-binding domain-containing protein [Usitatibacter sp.]|jgi:phosphate transport system substrate-binding protein|nr:substrate-binding domain-containing protein [Usitatibacter sp.]